MPEETKNKPENEETRPSEEQLDDKELEQASGGSLNFNMPTDVQRTGGRGGAGKVDHATGGGSGAGKF